MLSTSINFIRFHYTYTFLIDTLASGVNVSGIGWIVPKKYIYEQFRISAISSAYTFVCIFKLAIAQPIYKNFTALHKPLVFIFLRDWGLMAKTIFGAASGMFVVLETGVRSLPCFLFSPWKGVKVG